MAKGKIFHVDFKGIASVGGGTISVIESGARYHGSMKLLPILLTESKYWYYVNVGFKGIISFYEPDTVVILERIGNTFKIVSHPILFELYESIVKKEFTSHYKIVKSIRRLCRYTKKQLELLNVARVLGGE